LPEFAIDSVTSLAVALYCRLSLLTGARLRDLIIWGDSMSDLIKKVKDLYAAFSRGDIAFILASVADDTSWEYEAPPEVASSGIRHAPSEVAEYFTAIASQASDHSLEMTEFLSTDDTVAAFGRYQGTIKTTGIRVDTPLAHYFKFRDGKIVRHMQFANTGAFLEAIRGRPAGAAH
jgi:ketosteroid isomerase-like protein